MIQASCGGTIELLFEHAIEIEYKAAHIYERLSKLFEHVPGLSDFWSDLAQDEIRHAATLLDVQKLLTPEQLSARSNKKIWDNVTNTQHLLNRDLVGTINTLDDAYELAHNIENSEVNAIFQFFAAEYVPSDERKKFVVSEITQHLKKLMDFSSNFGDRNWRKGIIIQRI